MTDNNLKFWGSLMGKEFDTVEDFYTDLHGANGVYPVPGPYCISLVRTKCILGLLLVSVFYENGKSIQYLECGAKEDYYTHYAKMVDEKSMPEEKLKKHKEKLKKHKEELVLRCLPTYTFVDLGLTLPVMDEDRSVFPSNSIWHKNARSVTEKQFVWLLTNLPKKGWIDLDWEDWGK